MKIYLKIEGFGDFFSKISLLSSCFLSQTLGLLLSQEWSRFIMYILFTLLANKC
jgi:hypothetical protein